MKGGKFILCLTVFVLLFTAIGFADTPVGFRAGDILVSLSNGRVQWRGPDGTLIRQFDTGNHGQAKGMAFDAAGNLYVTHWFAPDFHTGNNIEVFTPNGIFAGTFGSSFDCNPTSIVFDSLGNAYVGQADCGGKVLKFNSAGVLLASFAVATEKRGSQWIDLASDDCTLFYTSAGPHVKRFNVCTNTQLQDFNGQNFGTAMWGLRILPDGSVLVAFTTNDGETSEIKR